MPSVNRATTVNCRLQPGIANINQSDQSCWIDLVISASNESLILVCIPRDSIFGVLAQSTCLSIWYHRFPFHSLSPYLLPSFFFSVAIQCVVIFAEQLFPNEESFVVHPKNPGSEIKIPLKPTKNVSNFFIIIIFSFLLPLPLLFKIYGLVTQRLGVLGCFYLLTYIQCRFPQICLSKL